MTIPDIKKLEQLMKLCRKHGVETFNVGDISFTIGAAPIKPVRANTALELPPEAKLKIPQFNGTLPVEQATEAPDVIKTDALTDEQLLNWSVQDPIAEAE